MAWIPTGEIDRSQRVVLNSNGGGTVTFEVRHANERWECSGVVCSSSQDITQEPYPLARVHDGAQLSDAHRAGWTPIANQDTLSGRFVLDNGTDLYVTFAGGIPGTTCTARITGQSFAWR